MMPIMHYCFLFAPEKSPTHSLQAVVGAIAFLGDNLLSSVKDRGLCLRSLQGDILCEYTHGKNQKADRLVASHNQEIIAASAGEDITVFDTQTGKCLQEMSITPKGRGLRDICMSHDTTIITANNGHELCALDRRSNRVVASHGYTEKRQIASPFFATY